MWIGVNAITPLNILDLFTAEHEFMSEKRTQASFWRAELFSVNKNWDDSEKYPWIFYNSATSIIRAHLKRVQKKIKIKSSIKTKVILESVWNIQDNFDAFPEGAWPEETLSATTSAEHQFDSNAVRCVQGASQSFYVIVMSKSKRIFSHIVSQTKFGVRCKHSLKQMLFFAFLVWFVWMMPDKVVDSAKRI